MITSKPTEWQGSPRFLLRDMSVSSKRIFKKKSRRLKTDKVKLVLVLIIIGLSLTLVFVIFSPTLAGIFTDFGDAIREAVENLIELITGVFS